MVDTGRKVGASPARDSITGGVREIEKHRRSLDPRVLARQHDWELGTFLGDPTLRKGERYIVLRYDNGRYVSGRVFSDTDKTHKFAKTNTFSTLSQIHAAIKGTLCTCGPREIRMLRDSYFDYERSHHEDSCPLKACV